MFSKLYFEILLKYLLWFSLKCMGTMLYYQMANPSASNSFHIVASLSSSLPAIVVSLNFVYDLFI